MPGAEFLASSKAGGVSKYTDCEVSVSQVKTGGIDLKNNEKYLKDFK